MKPNLLVSGGGHCHACIDVIEVEGAFSIRGIVEQSNQPPVQVLGYPVVGADADLAHLLDSTPLALVSVGQIKIPVAHILLHDLLVSLGADLPVIISPSNYVSTHASVGEGTIVMHDAVVMDHCHISTGARINGRVEVGPGSFIGSGVVLRKGVRVGSNCVIGAGPIVVKDLPASTRHVGTL